MAAPNAEGPKIEEITIPAMTGGAAFAISMGPAARRGNMPMTSSNKQAKRHHEKRHHEKRQPDRGDSTVGYSRKNVPATGIAPVPPAAGQCLRLGPP